MFAKPQSEHAWLQPLVGDWSFEHDCTMPDGSTNKTSGKMQCRSLGGLWLICESSGGASESDRWSSIMTVGFDPAKGRYVGTFIGSMMANIWHYEGVVDAAGKRLPLNCEGPRFDGKGMCPYRDTIEIVDNDTWLLISEMQTDDGNWVKFMTGTHTRA